MDVHGALTWRYANDDSRRLSRVVEPDAKIPPVDFSQTMRVLAAFARHGVEYVLVGSMAMAAQG